jgi:hypothetical protein
MFGMTDFLLLAAGALVLTGCLISLSVIRLRKAAD